MGRTKKCRRVLAKQIMKGRYSMRGKKWKTISAQARNFIADLLQVDEAERPTAQEARQSIWLNKSFGGTLRTVYTLTDINASMEIFAAYSKLQKLALMVVAHKSSSEEIGFLRKAFERFENSTGVISKGDFMTCLADYGYSDQELEVMFHGAVSYLSSL